MRENVHREPTLFIVGDPKRAREIKRILEEEWGGNIMFDYTYESTESAYYINMYGYISQESLSDEGFIESVANGWLEEYKLPEKQKFKAFDRVVVRASKGCKWFAGFYSHYDVERCNHILTNNFSYEDCLPYNEKTKILIGTNVEWIGALNSLIMTPLKLNKSNKNELEKRKKNR